MLFTNYENFSSSDSAYGNNLAAFRGTASVSVDSANTWTANTVVISSTPFDSYGLSMTIQPLFFSGTNQNRVAIEVYEGAVSSEIKLIDTFTAGEGSDQYEFSLSNNHAYFPIFIAAGKRLTFRVKMDARGASAYTDMYMHFYRNKPMQAGWLGNRVTTYGYSDATVRGVEVTPNATANTWGSWTEITASTTRYHKAFLVNNFPPTLKSVTDNTGYSYQIGIGGAGSEHAISPIQRSAYGSFNSLTARQIPIYRDIPAGSRLSCRVRASRASSPAFSVLIQGIS